MNTPSIARRHPALRWLVPVGVLGILGIAAVSVLRPDRSTEGLPQHSARQLLADLTAAARRPAIGYSGTVIAHVALGLPPLLPLPGSADGSGDGSDAAALAGTDGIAEPDVGPAAGGIADLLAGSHTMRYWYGGPDHQRVALVSPTDEYDVFYSGRDVWLWDSTDRVAAHSVVDDPAAAPISAATLTPQQLAARTLARIDATTTVSLGAGRQVADRPTDDLIVTPHHPLTRIGSVRISVDRVTDVPLAVQVFARGQRVPAIDVAFATVSFRAPHRSLLAFRPPDSATVVEAGAAGLTGAVEQGAMTAATVGSGWSSVVELPAGRDAVASARRALAGLPRVRGSWGSGHLAECDLLSMLVTDDGRVLVGAVDPAALYRAARR